MCARSRMSKPVCLLDFSKRGALVNKITSFFLECNGGGSSGEGLGSREMVVIKAAAVLFQG